MARYALIRSWVQCNSIDVDSFKKQIINFWNTSEADNRKNLYWKGWVFPNHTMNWASFIFYGGSVQVYAVGLIRESLRVITKLNLEIEGVFYVDIEEEPDLIWTIKDDIFAEALRP